MNIFDFKCKYCGGSLEEQEGSRSVGKCKYCGSRQTLPKLENEKRANLFERANHLRRNNEFDKAEALYEQLLNEDLTDPEAYWSLVLCRYGIEYVEDTRTKERVPTVNRAQMTSIFGDEDYKSAIANADDEQKKLYEAEATVINEIQKGILEISRREEPFDIFICYKETDEEGKRSRDSIIAQDLYHELVRDGYKVFFARVTLQGKLGSAYEPYIFSALNSAKVMVVLGTKKEHFEAVWVRNEWSRFLGQIKKGEKKVLIPAYRDMDAYDLPVEFSNLQALDMSRLGFLQELVEGIETIMKSYKKKDAAKNEPVASAKPSKQKKKSKALPIIIIALILAIGVGAAAVLGGGLLSKGSDTDSNADTSSQPSEDQGDSSAVESNSETEGNAEIPGDSTKLIYELSADGTAYSVTGPSNFSGAALVIPETYQGKPVRFISENAFNKNTSIKSITLPRTVVYIGDYALDGLTNLTTVTYEGSYDEWREINMNSLCNDIEGRAEPVCLANKSLVEPDTRDYSFVYAPDGKSYYVSSVLELKSVEYKIIVIPESYKGLPVTGIRENAFAGDINPRSVFIPKSVTYIGAGAFYQCSHLIHVYFGGSLSEWEAVEVESEQNDQLSYVSHAYNVKTNGEWSVIGTVNNSSWGEDFRMTESGENNWISDAFSMQAGDEFKVRMDGDWAVSFGADGLNGINVVVEAAGTYKVKFVYDPLRMSGEITLVPAS